MQEKTMQYNTYNMVYSTYKTIQNNTNHNTVFSIQYQSNAKYNAQNTIEYTVEYSKFKKYCMIIRKITKYHTGH